MVRFPTQLFKIVPGRSVGVSSLSVVMVMAGNIMTLLDLSFFMAVIVIVVMTLLDLSFLMAVVVVMVMVMVMIRGCWGWSWANRRNNRSRCDWSRELMVMVMIITSPLLNIMIVGVDL